MSWLRALDRLRAEPLALFLAGGALIFAANALLGPALGLDDNPRRIEVTRADLVRFTQLRARAFSEEHASESFDAMSDAQKRAAYDRYGHASFQQGGGGHQHAALAITALGHLLGDPGGLQGMRLVGRAQ